MVKPVDEVGLNSYVIITGRTLSECPCAKSLHHSATSSRQQDQFVCSKQGSGWLVCANLQRFEFINRQYHLAEIVVNYHADSGAYQQLVGQIARAFPELWGYVGIDLIETAEQMLVLEINPRLTTSFVGIHAALGINLAKPFAASQWQAGAQSSKNLSITIKVKQKPCG
jgi:hypothetical protein